MCAIFGAINASKAAELVVIGLHGNQHRAKDYAGVTSSDGSNLYRERGKGIARDVFTKEMLDNLHGRLAIGHIRYPTVSDDPTRDNTQPIMGRYNGHLIAIAHNGNLTNVDALKPLVKGKMATSMDTEYILRLLEASSTGDIINDMVSVLKLLRGSYSLLVITPGRIFAVRDKSGNRPLSIGIRGDSYFVSSENCAFPNVGAKHLRDVEPGMMIWFDKDGMHDVHFDAPDEHLCTFCYGYFAHPASKVFGVSVNRFRYSVGEQLEELFPVKADYVSPIPDSSNFYAMGFGKSLRSGEHWPVIQRSHYGGRSFIAATQAMRDVEVSLKFTFNAWDIQGKRIVLIDDSIVRGTTMPKIVATLRDLGALAVHVRIGYPKFKHRCTYGINTPTDDELVASTMPTDQIRKKIGADSLEYLPFDVLKKIVPRPERHCFACINGRYW